MSNLTKRDLVTRISYETGIIQQKVQTVIEHALNHVTESVAYGQPVEFRDFGMFRVTIRRARIDRNPHQPQLDVPIPERAVVKFKIGKLLGEKVAKISHEGLGKARGGYSGPGPCTRFYPIPSLSRWSKLMPWQQKMMQDLGIGRPASAD